jgi:dTDP-4-amino-4,6-dideoxygalactose transaminase
MSKWDLFVGSSGQEELNSEMPDDASWRMSAFQARAGLTGLSSLPQNLAHRRRLANFYQDSLQARGWRQASSDDNVESVYVRYPVRVANKWELMNRAQRARVELGGWFESVLHPIRDSFDRFGYRPESCPVAEQAANEVINLPVHAGVAIEEAERIIDFISRYGEKVAQSAGRHSHRPRPEGLVFQSGYRAHSAP